MGNRSGRRAGAFLILLVSALGLVWTLGLQAVLPGAPNPAATFPYARLVSPVPFAWTPEQFLRAFGLPVAQRDGRWGEGATIAFIESPQSFDPAAWRTFNARFLPGQPAPLPTVLRSAASGSASAAAVDETMLDLEWAHVVAPRARLVVVEAAAGQIAAAVVRAAQLHPTAISISYERSFPYSLYLVRSGQDAAVEQVARSVPVFAASGDSRDAVSEFDALPDVVSVGGTSAEWVYRGADPNSGSGYAWLTTPLPPWQRGFVHSPWRAFPDVSWIMEYPSVVVATRGGWTGSGGTSLSTPLWAALWALADTARLFGPLHTPLPPDADAVLYALDRRDPGAFVPSRGGWTAPMGLGAPDPTRLVEALRSMPMPERSRAAFPWTRALGGLSGVAALLLPAAAVLLLLSGGSSAPSLRHALAPIAMVVPPFVVHAAYLAAGNSLYLTALLSPALEQPWLAGGWVLLYALGTYRLALFAAGDLPRSGPRAL